VVDSETETGIRIGVATTGVDGIETCDKGVDARGTKAELLEGVKGAEVGTILDGGLAMGSSRVAAEGCAWRPKPGGPNPGGTVGVEERET
jgi:hypothetical protein